MRLWLPLLLSLIAGDALGAAGNGHSCNYAGGTCLCACLASNNKPAACADYGLTPGSGTTAGVVFCEDFEDPTLNDGDTQTAGRWGDGWSDKYGFGTGSCLQPGLPTGVGRGGEGEEGTHEWDSSRGSCFNVVQESACEVESDCVYDGTSALSARYRFHKHNDPFGGTTFAGGDTRNFGFTTLMKVTTNFSPDSPSKTDEFGHENACIIGCNTGNANTGTAAELLQFYPFSNGLKFYETFGNPTLTKGNGIFENDAGSNPPSGGYRAAPLPADYQQNRDWPKGTWACIQAEWDDWGTDHARQRYWINGALLIDISNMDMTHANDSHSIADSGGISGFTWNAFINGSQLINGDNIGYEHAAQAARVEDNDVVTNGAPVSCATVGFDGATTPTSVPGNVSLSASTYSITEGTGGTTTLTLPVTRTGGTDGLVTARIDITDTGGTEIYTDYTPDTQAQFVTFANGVGGTQNATISIYPDALDESNETFTATLVPVVGGAGSGSNMSAVVTITDDDPTPSLTIDNVSDNEGNSSSHNQNFSVRLSAASGRTVTVTETTSNITAAAGTDFTTTTGTVTFTPGQITQIVAVPVLGDTTYENTETYSVTLSSPSNATIATAVGTGTIGNDDPAPTISLSASPASISESTGTATFTATLSKASGLAASVDLGFAGTADGGGVDYTASGSSISIAAGSQTGTRTVTTVPDAITDAGETIIGIISNPTNASLAAQQTATVTISDDSAVSVGDRHMSTAIFRGTTLR